MSLILAELAVSNGHLAQFSIVNVTMVIFIVTVLDAGPRPWYQRMHWKKRINRYQADFVDVIHSDFNPNFSLGLTIPLGDVDFFPNAGSIQDGCWRDKWHKAWKELKDEGPLVSLDQMAR